MTRHWWLALSMMPWRNAVDQTYCTLTVAVSIYPRRAWELAANCGIRMSYSAKAHPWENGYQESFYQGFKLDLGDPKRFESVGEVVEAIHLQLYVYNHYRIHLSLKAAPKQYLAKQAQLVTASP